MAFMTIDAVDIDILVDGAAEEEPERIGIAERAFDGTRRSTQRAMKRVFSFTSGVVDEVAYAALRVLDDGLPHSGTGDFVNGAVLSLFVEVSGGEYIADGLLHKRLVNLRFMEE